MSDNLKETQTGTKLNIRVLTTEQEFDSMKPDWDDLMRRSDRYVFQTYEWNRVWWDHFGKPGTLYLIAVYDRDLLVGMIPMFWDHIEFFGKKVSSVLRFLGSNVSQLDGEPLIGLISYTDYLDVITDRQYSIDVIREFADFLHKNSPPFDRIILDVVPSDSVLWDVFLPLVQGQGYTCLEENWNETKAVNLTNLSWDEYLMSLSKNKRSHIRRAVKRIDEGENKVFDVEEIISTDEFTAAFEQFSEMHRNRWEKMGLLDTFSEEKNFGFHKAVLKVMFERGWVQLKKLVLSNDKGNCLAMEFNLIFGNRSYGLHCAVDDESEYWKQSPGTVLLQSTIREITESKKIEYYDFLRGDEKYKRDIINHSTEIRQLIILNPKRMKRYSEWAVKCVAYRKRLRRESAQIRLNFKGRSFLSGLKISYRMLKERFTNRFSGKN